MRPLSSVRFGALTIASLMALSSCANQSTTSYTPAPEVRPTPASNIEQACQKAKQSVVTIYDGSQYQYKSSGFLIGQSLVLTNQHATEEALINSGRNINASGKRREVRVQFWDGSRVSGTVVGSSYKDDLALIMLKAPQNTRPFLGFSQNKLLPGAEICIIGSPNGKPGTITRGAFIEYKNINSAEDTVASNLTTTFGYRRTSYFGRWFCCRNS
jgi:S1-C subfamily serine protease